MLMTPPRTSLTFLPQRKRFLDFRAAVVREAASFLFREKCVGRS